MKYSKIILILFAIFLAFIISYPILYMTLIPKEFEIFSLLITGNVYARLFVGIILFLFIFFLLNMPVLIADVTPSRSILVFLLSVSLSIGITTIIMGGQALLWIIPVGAIVALVFGIVKPDYILEYIKIRVEAWKAYFQGSGIKPKFSYDDLQTMKTIKIISIGLLVIILGTILVRMYLL